MRAATAATAAAVTNDVAEEDEEEDDEATGGEELEATGVCNVEPRPRVGVPIDGTARGGTSDKHVSSSEKRCDKAVEEEEEEEEAAPTLVEEGAPAEVSAVVADK